MKNNLSWLIIKADLTKLEFGIEAFPEMESETQNQKLQITNKVNLYCKQDLKTIRLGLMQRFSDILKCDFNTLWGYEN